MGGCLSCKTDDRHHVRSARDVYVRTVPPAQSNYDFYGSQFKEEDRYDPYTRPAYEIRPTPAPAPKPAPAPVPTVPSSQFKVTGTTCDPRIPLKLKEQIYKSVIRPVVLYGSECWASKKMDEKRLHVAEMRMNNPRPGALYGEYKCGCGYFWVSRLSWRDKYQQCRRCRAQVRPRNQRELRPTDFKRGDTQGLQHPEELCEMCKRVGGYCGKYK